MHTCTHYSVRIFDLHFAAQLKIGAGQMSCRRSSRRASVQKKHLCRTLPDRTLTFPHFLYGSPFLSQYS